MRGLYAHASERMRDDLKAALQARWEDSLRARTKISPQSPVPILGRLLAPFRDQLPVPVPASFPSAGPEGSSSSTPTPRALAIRSAM